MRRFKCREGGEAKKESPTPGAQACKRGRRRAAVFPPLPSRRSRVCGCVSACVSLAPSHTRSGTSAGGEPAALGSLLRPLRSRLAAAAAASAVAAGHGPARTGPSRRRRRPEPRFGSCLSRAARGAAAAAGGGWGCPGGAPSPQGERGAGAQPESPSSPLRAGYYDVSGQYDKEFECNNSESGYLYCCGTCYYRFCCKKRHEKLDQRQCTNYQSPVWVQTPSTQVVSPGPENKYDPEKDKTNFTVYITCGVIAFVIVAGVFAKVSYDKAHRPPREMNIHRALADILRQQGPIPIAHCERETISAIDTSPKENTPVRSSSKNHYTPVRTAKQTPGHYGKDAYRSGGPDLHNFISSGFVTLGRGHTKGDHQSNHPIFTSATQIPPHEKPRMNNILTSATEPYDLSFSRSFQNLAHLPPSYESAVKTNPSKYSSLKRLTDKEADEYYMRRRHLPDLAARGTLPLNVIQMSQQKPLPRERPRRPIRAMSQDRVLSPERGLPDEFGMPYDRILSDEQLLSTERLHSQDPLLSPERTAFPEQSLSRAISHTDVFVSTPVLDRYRMTKMHSHPSASNNSYATLGQSQTAAKRHAFASRRHNTVEQLHYIPGHHTCYTASKTEVTV
ncbi:PREDICTED: protein shisa-6 homolog [Propithecus coquereli]|uniref:protein shisa-6 homolog n=1 Tax=Propithecus coquereli TaxID=379532 RepID=UPI00063F225D|nr:PREDICTED: protein shisa-6 homolog [Propithecus coquereli]